MRSRHENTIENFGSVFLANRAEPNQKAEIQEFRYFRFGQLSSYYLQFTFCPGDNDRPGPKVPLSDFAPSDNEHHVTSKEIGSIMKL